MSALTTSLPPHPAYTNEPIFPLTVEQYHELIRIASLTSDDPVELIEGVLVFKMPKNPAHSNCNGRVQRKIEKLLPDGWCYRSQEPVTLKNSEPEPDGVVALGTVDDYAADHPGQKEIALLIEVADSTLDRDRGMKLRSYARSRVVCYWIVNLVDRQIEVYTQPNSNTKTPTYQNYEVFDSGQSVPLIIADNRIAEIAVSDLLPPLS